MLKKFLTFIGALLLLTGIKPAHAGTILENIARNGTLTVGTSFDLVPYAYYNKQGELDGYSINIVKLIQKQLEKELGKSIQLNFVETKGVREAIPKMITGEIDIACNTIFTWKRDQYVDFTIRYSISGIRLLVPKSKNFQANDSLKGKKIGIPPLTFVEDAIKLVHPDAIFVKMKSVEEGMMAIKEGKVDALAGDSLILDGIRQQLDVNGYEQFPAISENPYARYGIACMVPENNSTFLNIANYSIAKMMEGYLVEDKETVEMVHKWIGPDGIITIIDTNAIKEFFQKTINNHEQIPFPEK